MQSLNHNTNSTARLSALLVLLVACAGLTACSSDPSNSSTDTDLPDVALDTTPDASDAGGDASDSGDPDSSDTRPDTDRDTGQDTGQDTDTGGPGCDPEFEGEPCGARGCGVFVCQENELVCTGANPNVCDGCGELSNELDSPCELPFGATGEYVCDLALGDSVCGPVGLNSCGGEDLLDNDPGTPCGNCLDGVWHCDGPNAVVCEGAREPDACGGCGEMDAEPGASCGTCGDGLWACVGLELECIGEEEANACGGCSELVGTEGDACEDGCGTGLLTCSPDDERLDCVGPETGNACGGCGPITSGEQPGAACSDCGVWECDGDFATTCSNPRGLNMCGGCNILEGLPGTECGCGGVWECDGVSGVVCVGGDEPNACGGCSDLSGFRPIGARCGECGHNACVGPNEVACVDPGTNSCGSCLEEPDAFELSGECGCGGSWLCLGGLPSCSDEFVNACGGCGFLDTPPPGTECGTCGTYQCDGTEATVCVDGEFNICGGCAELAEGEPGDSCGECNVLACTDPNSLECVSDGENACGTCVELTAQPGFDCGECGSWVCAEDGLSVVCDDPGTNECGGCGTIREELGTECGPCDGNVWGCGDGRAECLGTPQNVCGGCEEIPAERFPLADCEECGHFACDPSDPAGNATVCNVGIEYACGACEPPAFFPRLDEGDDCTVCDVDGSMVCVEGRGECSTESEFNACAGCTELDAEPGESCGICGVYSCGSAESVVCIDPCL